MSLLRGSPTTTLGTVTPTAMQSAVAAALKRCAVACTDSHRAYRLAASSARDLALRSLFDALAREREEFLVALCKLGGPVHAGGSTFATVRRVAIEVASVVHHGDRPVIEECVRRERFAELTYERAREILTGSRLPSTARELLFEQETAISHARADLERSLSAVTQWRDG